MNTEQARAHVEAVLGRIAPEAELDEGYACYATEDFKIGYRSFLDKTTPAFKGR